MEKLAQTIKSAAERLAAVQTIALVLPDAPDRVAIGIAVALSAGLRKLGRSVNIFAAPEAIVASPLLAAAVEAGGEPIREFIISFDLARSPIRELRYEREQNRLNILLFPTGNRINREDIEFRHGPLRYDLVITVGVPQIEAAAKSLSIAPELPYEKPILNIDHNPTNVRYGEVNLVTGGDAGLASVPEAVYLLLEGMRAVPQEPAPASALLTALADATRSFSGECITPDTFRIAALLAQYGGRIEPALPALTSAGSPMAFAKTQLAARALVRSRLDLNVSTLWAVLVATDFETTKADSSDIPGVIDWLTENQPLVERIVLFSRRDEGELIHASIRSHRSTDREGLRGSSAFEEAGNRFDSRIHFESFAQAEASIRELLTSHPALQ